MTTRTHETTLPNLQAAPKPPFPPYELSITAKTAKIIFASLPALSLRMVVDKPPN